MLNNELCDTETKKKCDSFYKQAFESRTEYVNNLKEERQEWITLLDKFKNQQREFIEYLEQEIKMEEETFKKYGDGNINEYYVAANKVTLSKYKEIIGWNE